MYTLYGKKGSGSASTQAALEIVGAPYRVVETASWEPNEAFQELLKRNPLGQIPTLVLPDGSVLTASAASLIHLGGAHPESGLLPRAAGLRRHPAGSLQDERRRKVEPAAHVMRVDAALEAVARIGFDPGFAAGGGGS